MSAANPLARHGGLSYLEIPTTDSHASAAFYAGVLGWRVEQRSANDFRFEDGTGHLLGRWVPNAGLAGPNGPTPYYYVHDLEAAVASAKRHAGSVVHAARPEGDVLVALTRDPSGVLVGLWQFAKG